MESTVIGIIYHAESFTVATRRDRVFGAIEQHANVDDGVALAKIYALTNKYRHDSPMLHLFGDDVPRIVDLIRTARIACDLFNWFNEAAHIGRYANLGSQRMAELREQIHSGARAGRPDDLLATELEAFEEVGTGALVEYTRPNKVAAALGRFPARALAMLAANEYSIAPSTQYRPLASGHIPVQRDATGHDPLSVVGHDPYAPFNSTGRSSW